MCCASCALDLPFLSNLPDHLQVKVEPRLAFELNGSAFDNHGQSTPFAQAARRSSRSASTRST